MTAIETTDFFLALCERAGNSTDIDIDILAVGDTLSIFAPTVLAHVNELKQRGWIADAPVGLGRMYVRLTEAGASRSRSERIRRTGIAGRIAPKSDA
jgi:hypothetical protein